LESNERIPYGYIYITTNLINGKQYIGQHKATKFSPSYKGSGKILKLAIEKYGKENFSTDILEWCYNRDELAEREKYWIALFDATSNSNWYNITPGGYGVQLFGEDNHMFGKHHTEETKQKISEKLIGVMSGEKNPMYGVHLEVSEGTRKKISESLTGLMVGEKNPMYGKPAANRGKPMSEESKKKLSKSLTGKHPNVPIETQQKLREQRSKRMMGENNPQFGKKGALSTNYGKHPSEESIKKMSEAHKGKKTGFDNPACKPIYDINSNMVFSCIREVSEYFKLTYGQARTRIDKEQPIDLNGHTYILTRDIQKVKGMIAV
jgi:group I intron endonuclease